MGDLVILIVGRDLPAMDPTELVFWTAALSAAANHERARPRQRAGVVGRAGAACRWGARDAPRAWARGGWTYRSARVLTSLGQPVSGAAPQFSPRRVVPAWETLMAKEAPGWMQDSTLIST